MIYTQATFAMFSADAQRVTANLEQSYEGWLDAVRQFQELPTSMHWVKRGDTEYLAIKTHSSDPGTTIGKRTAVTETQLIDFETRKSALKARITSLNAVVSERASLYRRMRLLPAIPDQQAEILRELDIAGNLETDLMVVGTNAFAAYELACGAHFPAGNEETEDFDLTWCRPKLLSGAQPQLARKTLFAILKSIDSSYEINRKKPYQAVNSKGYQVELLAAPSRHPLPAEEAFNPMASLIEQEWLLRGTPIRNVVATIRNRACPLHVPDPRWMALHKLWLAEKPGRKASKKSKDARQGEVLLDAVRYFLKSSHPIDTDFVIDLPEELQPHFNRWAQERGFVPGKAGAESQEGAGGAFRHAAARIHGSG